MVQSNYTVSTAHQLLGGMQPVRALGSKSKSSTSARSVPSAIDRHVKVAKVGKSGPPPTCPLPPLPVKAGETVRMGAVSSTQELTPADRSKIRAGIPAYVPEEALLPLPATVYTPATPNSKDEIITLAPTVYDPKKVPVLERPRKGKEPAVDERKISQYFEYITPPISLGRTGSRRERKGSHTPTSSGDSDIYFSPVDATMSQVFFSSPQPSPPISPPGTNILEESKLEQADGVANQLDSLSIESTSAKQPETVQIASIGRQIENRKLTLSLAHVDRITTSLALAPMVQMRVRRTHLDMLPENMTTTVSEEATEDGNTKPSADQAALPTPPPSEASFKNMVGGIALIDTTIDGAPVIFTTDAFSPGKCTHLSLPYGLSTTNRLRIEPATTSASESKIILQSLYSALNRKTGARDLTLLAETDVTPSFARAALTELAHARNLTLDDIEIRTPTVALSPDDSIDWCNLDRQPDDENATSPVADLLSEAVPIISSSLSAETCTMQTLTLLSELARLQKAHGTFLVLQPTRYDSQGGLAGVKIPLVSRAMRERFAKMNCSAVSASGGQRGRLFREAVIAAVAPRFVFEEEFDAVVVVEGGKARVKARCVPLCGGGGGGGGGGDGAGEGVERWVCFLGGEFDVLY